METGNDMIVIFIMAGSGVFGGGERLVLRMAKWLCSRSFRTLLMYNKSADIVPELLEQLDEIGVERVMIPDFPGMSNVPDFTKAHVALPDNSRVKIICIQSEYNFFAAQMLQHRLSNCQCDVLHYVIHQDEFSRFRVNKTYGSFISNFFVRYYRGLVEKMESNGSIAYYLDAAVEIIHRTLKIDKNESSVPVIPVGMDAGLFVEDDFRRKYHAGIFTIVATARVEFPEKAFLLGVVDEFESILSKKKNMRLIIVGDGPDRTELEAKVAASAAADSIEMAGMIPYEKLTDHIRQANLYISNGSGPLDAARLGVPALVANFFSDECLVKGFWCDAPHNLGNNGTIPAREMISKTMDMSEADYLSLARRTYDTFLRYCSMDSFMEQLLVKRNLSEKPLLSRGYLLWSKLLRMAMNAGLRLIRK